MTFESAMVTPSKAFSQPAQVLLQKGWTQEQKFRALRQWKYDLAQLQVATEEHMPPVGPTTDVSIAQVHQAMESLGYAPDSDPVPSKLRDSHGGFSSFPTDRLRASGDEHGGWRVRHPEVWTHKHPKEYLGVTSCHQQGQGPCTLQPATDTERGIQHPLSRRRIPQSREAARVRQGGK
ncbi:MAG: hypothetical protein ABI822_01930 [Bryobacteraceae bacterium]